MKQPFEKMLWPDREADKYTYAIILVFLLGSWIVLSTTDHQDAVRHGESGNWFLSWAIMGSSHFVMAFCILMVPWLLNKAPLNREVIWRSVPVHLVGCVMFSVTHILLMVALRKLFYPVFFEGSYDFGLNNLSVWLYEFRKDAFTYVQMIVVFSLGRELAQLKLEAKGACEEARGSGRLTLKSGGRVIFLNAKDVLWARAASNYVEIYTGTGHHLVRMTLTGLENLLAEAGEAHVRIHRSYVVKRAAIREIIPTGEGDAKALLEDTIELPVSRRYRSAVEGPVAA